MPFAEWENLRLQLRVMIDIYKDMNNDIVAVKTSLKSIVKHLRSSQKKAKTTPPSGG